MSKKKKRRKIAYRDVELNIMPFIDVFSLLNTFLLMSAVFITTGVIEVQIPFLTNAPPDKKEDTERTLDVKVDMEKDKIEVITSWSKPPVNEVKKQFPVNKQGFDDLHKHMVEVRRMSPDNDKLQMFTEDDVIWEDISSALDSIKLRRPGDPVFAPKNATDAQKAAGNEFIFPKVVFASVML